MSNKKVPQKKNSGDKNSQDKKKKQDVAYGALLVSLVISLAMVIGSAIWIVVANLPEKETPTTSEQTSTDDDNEGWTNNY
ncbi:MAG: hypothetical protein IJX49_07240 [Clostridia bacterium]|nr:hypothetical protein [Clostridia bacterium]